MRHLPRSSTAVPARDAAARRTHELETLHGLGRELARASDVSEVLTCSLHDLVDMGWFSCGEAYQLVNGMPVPVAVGRCRFADVDACGMRGILLERAGRWIDAEAIGDQDGWTFVPIDRCALLALAQTDPPADTSTSFLQAVVEIVSSALKRASLHGRLADKERQRSRLLAALLNAQEEERARISRDLHDQIGQALTALLLGLDESIARPEAHRLAKLKELTSVTLDDVRRIALDLRPSLLDELGLEAAVRRYARDLQERYALEVGVEVHLPRLSRQSETVLYRVAQEALTNVVRHARASSASVVAMLAEGTVQLVVEDDGIGFDEMSLESAERVGLMGMRERLELLGGSLRIESASGRGTTVHARLPRR